MKKKQLLVIVALCVGVLVIWKCSGKSEKSEKPRTSKSAASIDVRDTVKKVTYWRGGEIPYDSISSDAAIMIEPSTGRVLYQKNADKREQPASMTKILPCVLALENSRPNDVVKISSYTAGRAFTRLSQNTTFTMHNLLIEMMLASDNVAAFALEDYFKARGKDLIALMNQKAQRLGARSSHFVNPNGLARSDHYSTARDMAKIAAYCWRNKAFRSIVGLREADVPCLQPKGVKIHVKSTNKMYKLYPGIRGIKTGYTHASGGCVAIAAVHNGMQLIVVVMRSATPSSRFNDVGKLLDYGFSLLHA